MRESLGKLRKEGHRMVTKIQQIPAWVTLHLSYKISSKAVRDFFRYEGRSINKLQKGLILFIFRTLEIRNIRLIQSGPKSKDSKLLFLSLTTPANNRINFTFSRTNVTELHDSCYNMGLSLSNFTQYYF